MGWEEEEEEEEEGRRCVKEGVCGEEAVKLAGCTKQKAKNIKTLYMYMYMYTPINIQR